MIAAGTLVWVRSESTYKAALAEVCGRFSYLGVSWVQVKLVTGYHDWDGFGLQWECPAAGSVLSLPEYRFEEVKV